MTDYNLHGDDFNAEDINKWYEDEKEASEELRSDSLHEQENNNYTNIFHGYRFIKDRIFNDALSIGGAYGNELNPVLDQIKGNIFIIESSSELIKKQQSHEKFQYVLAEQSGKINFKDSCFDLVVCLNVLHHIPNVSFVLSEIYRVLSFGGIAIISEPIVSMGNWEKERKGLTKRERGMPLFFLDKKLKSLGFRITKRRLYNFSPLSFLFRFLKKQPNSRFLVYLDYFLSLLFSFNICYERRNILNKISPSKAFYVIEKTL